MNTNRAPSHRIFNTFNFGQCPKMLEHIIVIDDCRTFRNSTTCILDLDLFAKRTAFDGSIHALSL